MSYAARDTVPVKVCLNATHPLACFVVCCFLYRAAFTQPSTLKCRPSCHSAVQTGPLKTTEPMLVWMTRLHVKLGYIFKALTSILNDESALDYWLSRLDPPAPVGGQEHFHLR